jgi:hypothetical protein
MNQTVRIFVVFALLVVPIAMWTDQNISPVFPRTIIPFLFFIPGLLGLYGLLQENVFIPLHGTGDETNRKAVLEFFNDRFPNEKFYKSENQFSFYDERRNLLIFYGRHTRILIIFIEKGILVNVSSFVRFEIPSPFHTFFHHLKIHSLGKRLIVK